MKTLRQLIESEFSDRELDCEVTSLKVTLKTPGGGSLKTDYSARREAQLSKLKGMQHAKR